MKRGRYTLTSIRELGPYITTEYAAELTGYSENNIRRLLEEGWVRGARWGARAVMVHRRSLMRYCEDYGRGPRATGDGADGADEGVSSLAELTRDACP